jgi:outer membrane protein X
MNKTYLMLLTLVLLFSASELKAQSTNFKPFRVDFATGYAMPMGKRANGGVLVAIEPKFAISNEIAVGLRLEGAFSAKSVMLSNGSLVKGNAEATSSYLITSDYFFRKKGVKMFAGLGTGLYRVKSIKLESYKLSSEVVNAPDGTKFGFAPRVGLESGHFRAAIEYNVVGKYKTLDYNYLAFKIGFFLGGGIK